MCLLDKPRHARDGRDVDVRSRLWLAFTNASIGDASAWQTLEKGHMAKNTRRIFRIGAVRRRSQAYNPLTRLWTKRGPKGRFMDTKANRKPFKGIRKER